MANISDDEQFEIDSILEQRKRKGLLEYLVRWKGSGDDVKGETWEPAKNLVNDYAKAVQSFTTSVKAKKAKRSSSRSGRASRSRSRSSSRSRKSVRVKEEARSQIRAEEQQKVAVEKTVVAEGGSSQSTRSSRSRARFTTTQTTINSLTTEAAELAQVGSKTELHTHSNSGGQGILSDSMKTQQELEVQRVHNEQCPVRDDDLKPRSAIWKVADYAVIVLFILSLIAALFLFLEKFIDLEEFKKQAFPNFSVLQTRLEDIQQNLLELAHSGAGRIADAWLYLIEQMKGGEEVKVAASQSKI